MSPCRPVACSPSCVADWSIAGLSAGHYRVRAVSSHGSAGAAIGFTVVAASPAATSASAKSPLVLFWIPAAQQASITDLRVVAGVGAATLLWSTVAQATGYQVERSFDADGPYSVIGRVGASIYRDSAATAGRVYYRVRAFSGASLGAPSAPVSTILVPAPSAQTGGGFVAGDASSVLALGATAQSATAGSELAITAAGTASAAVAIFTLRSGGRLRLGQNASR